MYVCVVSDGDEGVLGYGLRSHRGGDLRSGRDSNLGYGCEFRRVRDLRFARLFGLLCVNFCSRDSFFGLACGRLAIGIRTGSPLETLRRLVGGDGMGV